MIIIHQMTKVASRSWEAAAKLAAGKPRSVPVHCHFVVPANRCRMEKMIRAPAPRQTIANMLLPNELLRVGAAAWGQINAARERGENIRVITGMRDPVARSISLIVFMADFFGHTTRPLSPRGPMTSDYVIGSLQEVWESVLAKDEPDQSFEWLLWYLTGAFRTWFADELQAAFEVDVLAQVFPYEKALERMSTSFAEIFVYRVEDMDPSSRGHAALLAEAGDFLGTPLGAFPNVNTSSTRRSRVLTEEIQRRFWLPGTTLDAIYNDAVVRHFYTEHEIEAFKKRWSAAARGKSPGDGI